MPSPPRKPTAKKATASRGKAASRVKVARPKLPAPAVFRLRVQLENVVPTVWRRLLVSGECTLADLHGVIQAAMGWTDSHLHRFQVGEQGFGMPDDFETGEDADIDDASLHIAEAVGGHRRFTYEYDFGDGWSHDVVVEETTPTAQPLIFAVCLDGQNACPPEDVGGPFGYADFRASVLDPAHPDHRSNLEWVGHAFDPEAFDLGAVNAALQRLL